MEQIKRVDEQGKLQFLLEKVRDDESRKVDLMANTMDLQFNACTSSHASQVPGPRIIAESKSGMPTKTFIVNDVCLDQITVDAGLSIKDGRRLSQDYPEEYSALVNAIWQQEPKIKLLRTYETDSQNDIARAWLSNKYKVFDHAHMIESVMDSIAHSDAQWKITRGVVTDKNMYMQFKSEFAVAEPAVGDRMALGLNISNSETGKGSIVISQMMFTLACLNGMQTGQSLSRVRRPHLGKARGWEPGELQHLRQDTIDAHNHATRLEIRDQMSYMSNTESFDEAIRQMELAHSRTVDDQPAETVERLGQVLKLNESQTKSVLDGLIRTLQQEGYRKEINQATLVNAVTAVQHTVHADDVDDWQKLGGKVLELPSKEWEYVARKAA